MILIRNIFFEVLLKLNIFIQESIKVSDGLLFTIGNKQVCGNQIIFFRFKSNWIENITAFKVIAFYYDLTNVLKGFEIRQFSQIVLNLIIIINNRRIL
jgi:hypothetical protein